MTKRPFILFGKPTIDEEEIQAVCDVLRSGWIGMGPKCVEFEKLFADYVGSPFAVSVSSCTAALHLALAALGIGSGDEVITTSLTFVATISAIEHVGAKPILVDVDPKTLNIKPNLVEQAITSKTRAILPVHFGGLPCSMKELMGIAKQHNLFVVEDAAHAISAKRDNTMIGGLRNSTACFSFYPNKNITTVEGGMITTDSAELAEKCKIMRMHGLDNEAWKRYSQGPRLTFSEVVMPGFKYNMTDISATMGICQLKKLESFLAIRERYAKLYNTYFSDLPCTLQYQPNVSSKGNRHALHLYTIVLDLNRLNTTRDAIVQEIRDNHIGATVHYRAVHLHPYFSRLGYSRGLLPESERISDSILTVPLSPSMSEEEAQYTAETVRTILINHLIR